MAAEKWSWEDCVIGGKKEGMGARCYHLEPSLALFTEGPPGKGQCATLSYLLYDGILSLQRQH